MFDTIFDVQKKPTITIQQIMSPQQNEAFDMEKVEVKDTVAEKPVYCPTAFNNAYNHFDSLLAKYLWKDENLSTPERPIFSKSERFNIFFYITGIMCYKVCVYCHYKIESQSH